MAPNFEIFKCLYFVYLTSHGLIIGLTDFTFAKWSYCSKLLLHSRLKIPISLIFFFFLPSFLLSTSLSAKLFRASWVSSCTVLQWLWLLAWWNSWLWQRLALPFKLVLKWCAWIQLSIVSQISTSDWVRKEYIINLILKDRTSSYSIKYIVSRK